jgi:hypothetical protein
VACRNPTYDIRCQIAEPQNPADMSLIELETSWDMLRGLRGWRCLKETHRNKAKQHPNRLAGHAVDCSGGHGVDLLPHRSMASEAKNCDLLIEAVTRYSSIRLTPRCAINAVSVPI